MLRTIPKHKGTEHLQADIKTRIKQLTEELTDPKKGGARTGPTHSIRAGGRGAGGADRSPQRRQVEPARPTHRVPRGGGPLPVHDADAPARHAPVRGRPLPARRPASLSADFMQSWYVNALRPADAALLVVDLSDPECMDHVLAIRDRLDERKVTLDEQWETPAFVGDEAAQSGGGKGAGEQAATDADDVPDPFRIHLPTLLVANKSDLDPDPEEVRVLEELLSVRFPAVAVSAETGAGLDEIGALLFDGLGVVRVYTKIPGRPAEGKRPLHRAPGEIRSWTSRASYTRRSPESLKFARVWGSGQFDGQQVGADHPLADRDIVELHS